MARLDALRDLAPQGPETAWLHFDYFDIVLDTANRVVYIAQDDWLPTPGEPDPIPGEWREVLATARGLGMPEGCHMVEPAYDTVTGVYIWRIPLNLN
jgi:hypothetical protein